MDMRGFLNTRHREWTLPGSIEFCSKCQKIDSSDAELEFLLRQKMCINLQIEGDNFEMIFKHYPGILFHLGNIINNDIKKLPKNNETQLIKYFIDHKLVFGVGIERPEWNKDTRLADFAKNYFVIPVMKGSQMWQMLIENPERIISQDEWYQWKNMKLSNNTSTFFSSFKCLVCENYPFDAYPCNFIVSESICSIKSIRWPDQRHPQFNKKANGIIIYEESQIKIWPFLSKCTQIHRDTINHLGNMAIFTTGEIFVGRFLLLTLKKVDNILQQNKVSDILKDTTEPLSMSNLQFLINYYKNKKNESSKVNLKLLENYKNQQITLEKENNKDNDDNIKIKLVGSRNKIIPTNFLKLRTTAIRCGQIDECITQTKILSNSTSMITEDGKNINLDWNKIGRYTRNCPSNSYSNICIVASGIQKLLPKDSKTKEPKSITQSEVGFIDLLNTPDTPQRCGILLEMVLDVIISTYSIIHKSPEQLLKEYFPQLHLIDNPSELHILDCKFIYIIIHFKLYAFPKNSILEGSAARHFSQILPYPQWEYISLFGTDNLFRFTQYALKRRIACIELLEYETDQLWMCTSLPRISFKFMPNGQLYTSKELTSFQVSESFYESLPRHMLPSLLLKDDSNNFKQDFQSLWLGLDREKIPNLMGPTSRAIARPNAAHLPRISSGLHSFRHYAGIPNNSHSMGEIHQKTAIHSFYTTSKISNVFPIPCQNPMVAVINFDNPEDSITVNQGSVDRGLFCGVALETFIVRYNYGPSQMAPRFKQTYFDFHKPLFPGIQLGILEGVSSSKESKCNNLINFTNGEIEIVPLNEIALKFIWKGKTGDLQDPIYDDSSLISGFNKLSSSDYRVSVSTNPEFPSLERRRKMKMAQKSMAFRERHPNYQRSYRCFKMNCVDLVVLQSWRFSLMVISPFTPSMGDKLQTPTSQKGVIGRIVNEEDMPYINLIGYGQPSSLKIDVIINPHSLKRQAMDLYFNTSDKQGYMDSCFGVSLESVIQHLQLGQKMHTGILMNPFTGQPYFNKNNNNRPVIASLYEGSYMSVINHRASATMHTSRPGEVILSDLTGAPVRGKRGGLATGPMEQVSLRSIGAIRIHSELTQMRSDLINIELKPMGIDNKDNSSSSSSQIICGSKFQRRFHDDFSLAGINLGYKCTSHSEVKEEDEEREEKREDD